MNNFCEYCQFCGLNRILVEVYIVDNYRRLKLLLMVMIEITAFMLLMVLVLRLMIQMLIMETTVLMLMLISRGSTDSGIRSDDQLEIQVLV